ncbi:MAG: hypothetical protein K0U98_18850 [Deltaproteobacteria bacterium]|nr:hypothetical protein [Deltaproteobacteria bacterium]
MAGSAPYLASLKVPVTEITPSLGTLGIEESSQGVSDEGALAENLPAWEDLHSFQYIQLLGCSVGVDPSEYR